MIVDFIDKFECPICNEFLNVGLGLSSNIYLSCIHCKNIRINIQCKNNNYFFVTKLIDNKNDVTSLSNELYSTVYFEESLIEVEYDQSSFNKSSDLEFYYKFIIKASENMIFA